VIIPFASIRPRAAIRLSYVQAEVSGPCGLRVQWQVSVPKKSGQRSSPSQVYRAGIASPALHAALFSCIAIALPGTVSVIIRNQRLFISVVYFLKHDDRYRRVASYVA
jgi:hypothetical protein